MGNKLNILSALLKTVKSKPFEPYENNIAQIMAVVFLDLFSSCKWKSVTALIKGF